MRQTILLIYEKLFRNFLWKNKNLRILNWINWYDIFFVCHTWSYLWFDLQQVQRDETWKKIDFMKYKLSVLITLINLHTYQYIVNNWFIFTIAHVSVYICSAVKLLIYENFKVNDAKQHISWLHVLLVTMNVTWYQ